MDIGDQAEADPKPESHPAEQMREPERPQRVQRSPRFISHESQPDQLSKTMASLQQANLGQFSQLSKTMASLQQANLGQFSQLSKTMASLQQANLGQFSQLSKTMASLQQANLGQLNQLSKTMDFVYQPQIAASLSQLSKAFMAMHQSRIAISLNQFSRAIEIANPSVFMGFNRLARDLHVAAIDSPVTLQFSRLVSQASSLDLQRSDEATEFHQPAKLTKAGNRDTAAMLTVAVFLIVYIGVSFAMVHNPDLASFIVSHGPSPFEAAMGAGAFTFWISMNI